MITLETHSESHSIWASHADHEHISYSKLDHATDGEPGSKQRHVSKKEKSSG